ncbi:hypothetical protein Q5425_11700 [Amycolatopsis sp. A133]|uniref:DoxX family protein n=1 Tax=Amycolatopsis sp. A133 TaxID=3064472 RepID=UPI0027FC1C90|nr:hypothetical protein [Amycolatopsis sp. A133]MDQ7804401.1 hypothetical protein [Amycolatopsis sp. A133]
MIFGLLVGATLLFRLRFPSWRVAAAHGLAVMLVVTASAHFAPDGLGFMPGHGTLTAMVPPFVPFPSPVVYGTGVLELLGALGLVLPRTRRAAGWCLVVLFACLLPANVHAALTHVPGAGDPLWIRIPEQLAYLAAALAATAGDAAPPTSRRGEPEPSAGTAQTASSSP